MARNVLLGITGGIAAYKIPWLVRGLVKQGCAVQVIMTEEAKAFVTPLTLATVSGNPVLHRLYNPDDGTWHNHVDLGEWADLVLIAPATANTLAKMAQGMSDSLLLTTYLSARCPVWVSPAMDLDMWHHPATQANLDTLRSHGVRVIPPAEGPLASGLSGPGRLPEPETLVAAVMAQFGPASAEGESDDQAEAGDPSGDRTSDLSGMHVLLTAGPTQEAIDPVRYIGNRSSGKMGMALAESLARRGARVSLVKGPSNVQSHHPGVETIPVVSAQDMYEACMERWPQADVFIGAAAVADYTPADPAQQKIKKKAGAKDDLTLTLYQTEDILASVAAKKKSDQLVVGFALETNNEVENAIGKLERKNLDMIVLNSLRDAGAGFGGDTNQVSIIHGRKEIERFALKSKAAVAEDIVDHIARRWHAASTV